MGILLLVLAFLLIALPSHASHERFGVNSTTQGFARDAIEARDVGVGALRLPLPWEAIEPRPSEYDWAATDAIVKRAVANHQEIHFVLRSISSWGTVASSASTSIYHSSSPPRDINQWVQFLKLLVGRYAGRGVSYGIENEVNAPAFWNGTVDEYIALLKASYAAIHQADAAATVLHAAMGCGIVGRMTPTDLATRHDNWLKAILESRAYDVVNVHDYYFPSDLTVNGFTFLSYLARIRKIAQDASIGKPVWITEAGYVSKITYTAGRTDPGSPTKQARWLKEAYGQAFGVQVQRVFWLLMRDRQEPYFGSMGLMTSTGIRRPAWYTMRGIATG